MNQRTKMSFVFVLLLGAIALTVTPSVRAQALSGGGGQAHDSEFFIGPSFLLSTDVNYDHGTTVHTDSTAGFKIGGWYYLTDHFSLGGSYAYANASFNATIGSASNPPGSSQLSNGHLYINQFMFNGRYHFLNGPIRPYVLAGMGWNYTDSNVATGYSSGCWWDPWWGYYCGTYAHTKSTNGFTYQVGAGLEVNFSRTFALTLGYNETWVDWSHGGTPGFGGVDFMFVWRFPGHW
jgi:opacity protein-like surface antigen